MTAAHVTSAAVCPWNCHHSPFRVLPTSLMPSQPGSVSASPYGSTSTAVWCATSTSDPSPADDVLSWKLSATCTRRRPSEADIAREHKLLQLRVIYLCDRFGISQDRIWIWTRRLCAWFHQASVGGPQKAEPANVFASRAFVTVTLAANVWTQIVYEEKSNRVHPRGPTFPCQLVSHSPTHWITQEALLNMIDAIDADMHARVLVTAERTRWLLLLDCATARCEGISDRGCASTTDHGGNRGDCCW